MVKCYQYSGVIYKYRNKVNNKVYIGQTVNEKQRKIEHKCSVNKNTLFARAIKKYGFDTFEYTVLFRISCATKQDLINTLNIKEITAIKYYDSTNVNKGYNISKGGGGTIGVSPWNKGLMGVYSQEHIEHLKVISTGRKHTDKTKESISNSKKGSTPWNKGKSHIYSEESINKMRMSHLKLSSNGCEKPVFQIFKEGTVIRKYNSIKEARKDTGINNIVAVLKGRRKYAGGYSWRYV